MSHHFILVNWQTHFLRSKGTGVKEFNTSHISPVFIARLIFARSCLYVSTPLQPVEEYLRFSTFIAPGWACTICEFATECRFTLPCARRAF